MERMKVVWFTVFALLSTAFASYIREDGRPVVDVPQGTIVGVNETKDNISLYAFRSIPFALPPLDSLRFKIPLPSGSWSGKLDASESPIKCTQFGMGSEDCLYLDIYTPEVAINTTLAGNFPVMVWIYGGAFLLGSIEQYEDVQYFIDKGVIVALVQYRVGVIGFMSTEDDEAPGNLGLWDQSLGMKWVYDNIIYFGGDPNRITLFGESAGAASVHYHMLSPYSQDLFQQAILQSGSTFVPWSTGRDFYEVSVDIAESFECPTNSTADMILCLQGVNNRILSLQGDHWDWNNGPIHIGPRIDYDFVPDQPATLVRNGQFARVPTMMGVTRDEGSVVTGEMYTVDGVLKDLNSNFSFCAPISLLLFEDEGYDTIPFDVYSFYNVYQNITEASVENFTLIYTHHYYHIPMDCLTEFTADINPTYLYELDYRGVVSLISLYQMLGLDIPEFDDYVCHSDDLPYLFDSFHEDDRQISEYMIKLWTDFAKTGNPTPDGSLGITWPPVTSTNFMYLSIDDVLTIQPYSRQPYKDFWQTQPLRLNNLLYG